MRRAIAAYAVVALALLWGLDRLWPIWPVHGVAIAASLVVVALALLAAQATGRG